MPQKSSPPRPSRRPKDHVGRPRNAFMIFRSDFCANRITGKIEHDHRHISRIVAHCWRNLSDSEKQEWRDKADVEKLEHSIAYPDYKFSPVQRANKPVKRNVKRNSTAELNRCRRVAELLLQGKQGHELETAVKTIDASTGTGKPPVTKPAKSDTLQIIGWRPRPPRNPPTPPFKSPLLPPTELPASSSSCQQVQEPSMVDTDLCPPAVTPMHTASQSEPDLLAIFQNFPLSKDSEACTWLESDWHMQVPDFGPEEFTDSASAPATDDIPSSFSDSDIMFVYSSP